jgi:hypothetical protein
MIKLYKRTGEVFLYHEVWPSQGKFMEHWGVVGTRGTSRPRPIAKGWSQEETIQHILRKPLAEGFAPISAEHLRTVLVEYQVQGHGSSADLKKRNELEERMNNMLGWSGLGHCDGGSIGSGSMDVCCIVVDFAIAKAAIETDLHKTSFGDYSRIYDATA